MICPFCNNEIKDNAKFCDRCGSTIPRCPSCGLVLQKRMKYCQKDGTPIPEEILQLFDVKDKQMEASAKEDFSKRTTFNTKVHTEKPLEEAGAEKKESSIARELSKDVNTVEQGEEQGLEQDTESGNKRLIGLLVFFTITFTASVAGLLLLLSGGYVTFF